MESHTILRIKRKRNEEPLDALVVDSTPKRKKPRDSQQGVFHFAQTLETSQWNEENQKLIQTKITDLKNKPPPTAAAAPPSTPPTKISSSSRASKLTYAIVPTEEEKALQRQRRDRLTEPPKVLSTANDTKRPQDLTMYDAVLSVSGADSSVVPDKDVEKFLPMLEEYLKLHEAPDNDASSAHSRTSSDDYVYDIFYHRPTTIEEWNSISTNMALLTGFPSSTKDEYDSDSDDEFLDEADEDSNDENWFTNDYPDEESASSSEDSDMFQEGSEDVEGDDYNDLVDKFQGWRG